jgi:hypothetical protein
VSPQAAAVVSASSRVPVLQRQPLKQESVPGATNARNKADTVTSCAWRGARAGASIGARGCTGARRQRAQRARGSIPGRGAAHVEVVCAHPRPGAAILAGMHRSRAVVDSRSLEAWYHRGHRMHYASVSERKTGLGIDRKQQRL